MSGFAADVTGSDGMIDDATHFIGKPFSLATLTSKVREMLDGE